MNWPALTLKSFPRFGGGAFLVATFFTFGLSLAVLATC
jgi:hypothetical protein